jgi:photosystem II stability/assembly factor-like uncharacterized protein
LDDDASFASPEISATTPITGYTPSSPLPLGIYYWRVQASNADGPGPWSEVWSFWIAVRSYMPVVIREPGVPFSAWSRGTGIEGRVVVGLAAASGDCNTVYAATDSGLFKSTDGGASWAFTGLNAVLSAHGVDPRVLPSLGPWASASPIVLSVVTTDPTDGQVVYAATLGSGIFKSTDGGASWEPHNVGLTDLSLHAIATGPRRGRVLYAGGDSGGVFKSTDRGGSWFAVNDGLGSLSVRTLAVAPSNSQMLYAGTQDGVYRSANGGGSWVPTAPLGAGEPRTVAVDPGDSKTVYIGLRGGGVYTSTTGGDNWTAANTGLGNWEVPALVIHPTNNQRLYAGTNGGGVYVTTDGGGSWSAMNDGLGDWTVESLVQRADCDALHAGTRSGAWRYGP